MTEETEFIWSRIKISENLMKELRLRAFDLGMTNGEYLSMVLSIHFKRNKE